MIITPQHDCTWTYQDNVLSINLNTDDGQSYLFKTHYLVSSLDVKPEKNSSFCIEDANLMTTFLANLNPLLQNEGAALDLAINAVACTRFCHKTFPASHFFYQHEITNLVPLPGQIVSIYAKNGNIADCIVLESQDSQSLVRLMLLNRELIAHEGRVFKLGEMIRVSNTRIFAFRGQSAPNQSIRTA